MLTPLDTILFPLDDCEVYEYSSGKYVYAIYKNGRSSLRKSGFRKLDLSEIKMLDSIDVFIRDPFDRYVSGVQTYLNFLPDDYDRNTVLKFIDEFLFLNRHHVLQLYWIINLSRFVSPQTTVNIRHIDESYTITKLRELTSVRDVTLVKRFQHNNKLQYHLLADNVLYKDLMNKTVTINEILSTFKNTYEDLYNEITSNVLP